MPSFDTHETFQSGAWPNGQIFGWWATGSLCQLLVPEPDAGFVRIPLLANIQNDGGIKSIYTCHGMIRRTAQDLDPGWTVNFQAPACILWVRKLLAEVMVGGEFFLPVDVFPIPRGFELYVEWADASGGHCHRTRCVSVQVPASAVDWSRILTNFGNFKFVAP